MTTLQSGTEGWHELRFGALSVAQLYALLQFRQSVFVVEQNCPYLDADGLDQAATHIWLEENGKLVAYQRCLPPGTPYGESSIGRIIVDPAQRGRNLGRALVQRGIDFNLQQWPGEAIRIGAQAHLQPFYASLGFVPCGPIYDEDGIDHIHMLLTPGEDRAGMVSGPSGAAT
ncbi:MAG: GNAT family N-acetyltransferase [Lamprobacter sp.]|uniref:GNAT family N-acetyltransferase n=1 Tax=Lamprobacter sp. TaxID=3100796 RepID=UPI002B25E768|nr:GNAT family N-acetyltransferase [Lamprobacter sp.]MEA3644006.1 GNAT family N-acetyltransferase [Lamprobacter sp.]